MLQINGAGCAFPELQLTNEQLQSIAGNEAGRVLAEAAGIQARSTTLPMEYLHETRNRDPFIAKKMGLQSPTNLAEIAARQAILRAGIEPQQIGLVLAESLTVWEMIPSEAQRVAGALDLKVPAFDISVGIGSISAHLAVLNSWEQENIPDYVLCVTTNTTTQWINYERNPRAAAWYGDGAAACVVSPRIPGRLSVLAAEFCTDFTKQDCWRLDLLGELSVSEDLQEIWKNYGQKADNLIVQDHSILIENLVRTELGPNVARWSLAKEHGDLLGVGPMAVLATHWENLITATTIKINNVGPGLSYGSALLRVV